MSNGGACFFSKQFVNETGTPYSGVKVYHYTAGTSTDKTVWSDEGKTTEASQPVTGDSRGYVWFYADGDYRLKVTDSSGNVLYDWDNARITQDTATMWEGNYGLSYPNASATNRWQMFLKHTAGNKISQLAINDGTSFIPVFDVDANLRYAADTGAANAYVIAPSPPITAYATGQEFSFKAVNANTAASTLAVNGLVAKSIKKDGADALIANDILAAQMVTVQYDGTNFQMKSPSGESVYEDATQTLTNKTLTSPVITGSAGPSFSVHKNGTNQASIADATWTLLTWSTEVFDTNSNFASNRFTPTVAGKYMLYAQAAANMQTETLARVSIYKNGSLYQQGLENAWRYNINTIVSANATDLASVITLANEIKTSVNTVTSSNIYPTVEAIVDANGTTDYFEVYFYHNAGVAKTVDGTATWTYFHGAKIG